MKCILEFLRIRFDREASLVRSSWEAGDIAAGSMVLLLPWEGPGSSETEAATGDHPETGGPETSSGDLGRASIPVLMSLSPGRTRASCADQQGNEHMDHALSRTTMKTEECLFNVGQTLKMF